MAAWSDLRGGRHAEDRVHLGDPRRHRREKVTDLGGHILALKIGVPVDPTIVSDVARIHV